MTRVIIISGHQMQIRLMITTVKPKGLRKKLLDACTAKQLLLIDDFKERINALTESEGIGNEESFDNQDVAGNTVRVSEINTLNDLLQFANDELAILENLKKTQDVYRDRVVAGAIVVTNHHTFFISASIENFFVEGHVYIGISTNSPIFKKMEGKSKGDTFSFKELNYTIKDIF